MMIFLLIIFTIVFIKLDLSMEDNSVQIIDLMRDDEM